MEVEDGSRRPERDVWSKKNIYIDMIFCCELAQN
jgi:hypothetical protein